MLSDSEFRVPHDLRSRHTSLRRVLAIGTCLIEQGVVSVFPRIEGGCPVDHVLFNNASELPDQLPQAPKSYDFAILQLPLPAIIRPCEFPKLAYDDVDGHHRALAEAKSRLRLFFRLAMKYNQDHGLLTIVWNFQKPQFNYLGRLLPKNDVRNLACVVGLLNEELERLALDYRDVHVFDFDELTASLGKRYFQDDILYDQTHLGAIGNGDLSHDQERITKPASVGDLYKPRLIEFYEAAWEEICAIYRTARGIDAVKMVVFDLDDTLWRGVVAENEAVPENAVLGWPAGIAEVVHILKKRGIITAIVSKNDEDRIRKIWPQIWHDLLTMDDFPIRRINWNSKAENMAEILASANLLPQNVVFVDDNPVEREAVRAAFPEIRTFGAEPYLNRRILLCAAETQVPRISEESARRNALIAAKVQRDDVEATMDRDAFLKSLDIRVTLLPIAADSPHFARSLELINKTNQFNTTGRRWTEAEFMKALREGVQITAWSVADRFADHGVVGVAIVQGDHIAQMVMSCRVFGLGVEQQVLGSLLAKAKDDGHTAMTGHLLHTEANGPCREIYAGAQFVQNGDLWVKELL